MKAFRVTGEFWMGDQFTPFTIETVGVDEEAARERLFSTIGSRHRVNRHAITIASVKEISGEEITDQIVQKRLEMVK